MNRRALLCGLAAAAVTACGNSAPAKTAGVGSAKPGDRIASVADVPVGGGVLVDTPGNGQLLLVQPASGEVRAFNPACPHLGSLVSPAGRAITCPTHGSTFDLADGQVLKGPSPRGLTEVSITVSGTDLLLG